MPRTPLYDTSADGHASYRVAAEAARLATLEQEIATLREALATRQEIGAVTGYLAHRYGCTFEQAWSLLVRVSQHTNIKVREIARVLTEAIEGRCPPDKAPLLAQVSAQLPNSRGLFATSVAD